jgi:hypothetical protein
MISRRQPIVNSARKLREAPGTINQAPKIHTQGIKARNPIIQPAMVRSRVLGFDISVLVCVILVPVTL